MSKMEKENSEFCELEELLDSKYKYYIFPHHMPDGDTLGSSIAINKMLKHFGLEGNIVIDDDIPSNLSFLCTDGFIKTSELDYDADIVFSIDCGGRDMYSERLHLIKDAKVVNIDHHKTNSVDGELNYVYPDYSSTGALVYKILEFFNIEITPIIAESIYTAIVTDTGNFKYSNTDSDTFEICAKLMEVGFEFNKVNVALFQNKSLDKVTLLQRVFSTLETNFDGKLAFVTLDSAIAEEFKGKELDTDGIVEFVRDISGIEVVIFYRQLDNETVKVSMRSKYDFDVTFIADIYEGGGHTKAAGFRSEDSIDEIKANILKIIEDKGL